MSRFLHWPFPSYLICSVLQITDVPTHNTLCNFSNLLVVSDFSNFLGFFSNLLVIFLSYWLCCSACLFKFCSFMQEGLMWGCERYRLKISVFRKQMPPTSFLRGQYFGPLRENYSKILQNSLRQRHNYIRWLVVYHFPLVRLYIRKCTIFKNVLYVPLFLPSSNSSKWNWMCCQECKIKSHTAD